MKKAMISLTSMFLVVGLIGVANATLINFDFTGGDNTWNTDSAIFTGDDGSTRTRATAIPSSSRNLYLGQDGLGVYGFRDSAEYDDAQVDGYQINEWINFDFRSPVRLVSASFSHVGSNDDFAFYANGRYFQSTDIPNSHTYTFQQTWISSRFWIGAVADNDDFFISGIQIDDGAHGAPVPEPATMMLMGTGLAGLAFSRRKKANKA